MAKLVASTWNRDSGDQQQSRPMRRLAGLRQAVQAMQAKVDACNYERSGLVRGIFVGPEYLFASRWAGFTYSNGTQVARSVTQDSHDALLRELMAISSAYPRILMLPGTIAWKKPLALRELQSRIQYYKGREDKKLFEAILAEFALKKGEKSLVSSQLRQDYLIANGVPMPTEPLPEQELKLIRDTYPMVFNQLVAVVAPQVDPLLGSAARKAAQRYAATPKQMRHMMQNTAYALLNGKVVFAYAKQGNFHEEAGDSRVVFAPGAKSGVQEIEGIHFGFEVCLDHNIGTLKKQLRGGRKVDVQIVMSDYVKYSPAHVVVRDGGVFVHASTEPTEGGVWTINSGIKTPVPLLGTDTIAGSDLTHWEIDVEVDDPFSLAGTFMQDIDKKLPARKWATVAPVGSTFRSHG